MQTLADFWPLAAFLVEPQETDEKAWQKVMGRTELPTDLAAARAALAGVDPFAVEPIEAALRAVCEQRDEKPGKLFQPIRVAITGGTVSPGIFESVAALGSEESLRAHRRCSWHASLVDALSAQPCVHCCR